MQMLLIVFLFFSTSAMGQAIEWVTIGDPVNDPYPTGLTPSSGCCTVFYNYEISRHEITNQQYIEMLDAVAASDPNELYTTFMASNVSGGITRTGSDGSYVYAIKPGYENIPVVYVSFMDVIRFANWLHNDKPAGVQDNSTTEDGAYTITPDAISNNTISRNADARFFIPTWDEWRKAGYYDGDTNTWYDYPIGSNSPPVGSIPSGDMGNNANCGVFLSVYEVGSYPLSASPYGTLDQAGNVAEWTETIAADGREYMPGYWGANCTGAEIDAAIKATLTQQASNRGFRLARPGIPVANIPLPFGTLIALAVSLLGVAAYRFRN